ncbi:transglycosylase SLT domain-containing protein [Streptomyces sp. 049-1]|uniref:transglycosylase SLT domain-containing protein n=1 Tax=Streptomyces sp. 049-1 TaxID=2789264 RepID=UPI003980B089
MTADSKEGGPDNGSTAVRNTIAAGTGCGCLLSPVALVGTVIVVIIIGGLGVLLYPLIVIILLFHGHGPHSPEQAAGKIYDIALGDGTGKLDASTVPNELVDAVKKAGGLCGAVGPVVIASQIEKESSWRRDLVGPNGEQGISQLPPDVFDKYGADEDDNHRTSALDGADSIVAQGNYMCDLADQAKHLIDDGDVKGKVLDLALAAYDVGMDAVRAAGGVPQTNEAQGYVLGVRVEFAKYAGIASWPAGSTPGVTPTPSDGATPTPLTSPATSITTPGPGN